MKEIHKKLLFFLGILLVVLVWLFIGVDSETPFEYNVPTISQWSFLEHKYLYLYIHIFTIVPILALSFDKKVAYYKWWKSLFPAIIMVGLFFIGWDALFTDWNVWGFNEKYFIGWSVLGLPIEEWLFFVSIPFASIFIYACLNAYFPKDHFRSLDFPLSIGTGILLIGLGLYHFEKIYTSTTFLMAGIALVLHYCFFENSFRTKFYRANLLTWIPFLFVDGILTGGWTKAPIVLYNPEEFLGIRIGSVPLEDSVYGMLLLLMICSLMHWTKGEETEKTSDS